MASNWNPEQYERFAQPRLQPAIDLLSRVTGGERSFIVDLGCGGGQVTTLLASFWPEARILGIDSSREMLAKAEAAVPMARFLCTDIEVYEPAEAPDLVVSNAALHWVENHETIMLHWLRLLAPGGVLAVQMPRNHAAASHQAIQQAEQAGPWRDQLVAVRGIAPVHTASHYATLLLPHAAHVEAWETEYVHVLSGPDPVFEWTSGAALRPYLTALGDDAGGFVESYKRRLREAYPPLPDGRTLFPFKRVFVVATAAA